VNQGETGRRPGLLSFSRNLAFSWREPDGKEIAQGRHGIGGEWGNFKRTNAVKRKKKKKNKGAEENMMTRTIMTSTKREGGGGKG